MQSKILFLSVVDKTLGLIIILNPIQKALVSQLTPTPPYRESDSLGESFDVDKRLGLIIIFNPIQRALVSQLTPTLPYRESDSLSEFSGEPFIDGGVSSSLGESGVVHGQMQVSPDLLRLGDGLQSLLDGVL